MTHEKKDKKTKNCSSLKDEFIFPVDPQNYYETAYLLRFPENAIRLLESIESLKEGKVVVTSFFDLPQK